MPHIKFLLLGVIFISTSLPLSFSAKINNSLTLLELLWYLTFFLKFTRNSSSFLFLD